MNIIPLFNTLSASVFMSEQDFLKTLRISILWGLQFSLRQKTLQLVFLVLFYLNCTKLSASFIHLLEDYIELHYDYSSFDGIIVSILRKHTGEKNCGPRIVWINEMMEDGVSIMEGEILNILDKKHLPSLPDVGLSWQSHAGGAGSQ